MSSKSKSHKSRKSKSKKSEEFIIPEPKEPQLPTTREQIIRDVTNFFQDKFLRDDYYRDLEQVQDPYCTLDEDLTYDEMGRVDLFLYIEKLYGCRVQDKFVWKVQRLAQIYDYLERRLIKEGNRPLPEKPSKKKTRAVSDSEKQQETLPTQQLLGVNIVARPAPNSAYQGAKIAFLFPGQGSQKVGMAADITPEGKKLFDRAAAILGYDLLRYCREGPDDKLNSTAISQPAILVSSLAALEKLYSENSDAVKNCTACAGLSLGEYTSLVFAGAMSFEDALRVVKARGEAMQEASEQHKTAMLSILGLEVDKVQQVMQEASSKGFLTMANFLCPGNVVLSGDETAIIEAERICQGMKKLTRKLKVSGAFHSKYMQPASEKLTEALKNVTILPPKIQVIANVDGKAHSNPEEIRTNLIKQLIAPVLWEDSMHTLLESNYTRMYEVGPGNVLVGLMRHIQKRRRELGKPQQAEVINFTI